MFHELCYGFTHDSMIIHDDHVMWPLLHRTVRPADLLRASTLRQCASAEAKSCHDSCWGL